MCWRNPDQGSQLLGWEVEIWHLPYYPQPPARGIIIVCGYKPGGSRERSNPPRGSEVALVFPLPLFTMESCGRGRLYTLVSVQLYSCVVWDRPPGNTTSTDKDQGPKSLLGTEERWGTSPSTHPTLSPLPGCQGGWEAGAVLLGGLTWSPRTTDLQAAKEIVKHRSVTVNIKVGMPLLDPDLAVPAGAEPRT